MKPAMKGLIGLVVVGVCAFGGSKLLDKMETTKTNEPQVAQESIISEPQAQEVQVQYAQPVQVEAEVAPVLTVPTTPASDAGVAALIAAGNK